MAYRLSKKIKNLPLDVRIYKTDDYIDTIQYAKKMLKIIGTVTKSDRKLVALNIEKEKIRREKRFKKLLESNKTKGKK